MICLTTESNTCQLEIALPKSYCGIKEINKGSTRHTLTDVAETTEGVIRQDTSDIIGSVAPLSDRAPIRHRNPGLGQHLILTQPFQSVEIDEKIMKELADRAKERISGELKNLLRLKEQRKAEASTFRRIYPLSEASLSDSDDDTKSCRFGIKKEIIAPLFNSDDNTKSSQSRIEETIGIHIPEENAIHIYEETDPLAQIRDDSIWREGISRFY